MFVSKKHNHHACVLRAKQVVAERLSTAPTKMNENDARVLDILNRVHRASGAYEIASQASDVVKKLQPNQVYRAMGRSRRPKVQALSKPLINQRGSLNFSRTISTLRSPVYARIANNITQPSSLGATS